MNSRHRYIVTNSDITGGVSTNLQILLVLCIQYEEDLRLGELFLLIAGAQRLQNDEIISRPFDLDDVHDAIVDIN